MAARPLLLLSVLLGGLLGLKALALVDGVSAFLTEPAFASSPPPAEEHGDEHGDAEGDSHAEEESHAAPAEDTPREPVPPPPGLERRDAPIQMPTASQLSLETDLARRRRDLEQRAEALDTREQLLAVAEARYDARLVELEAVRAEIQGLLGQLETRRQESIDSQVNTFSQLEAPAAAAILVAMDAADPETLIEITQSLQSGNPRKFAAIMAEMPPAFAASLTSRLRASAQADPTRAIAEARDAVAAEG